ncbi:MAG: hypothetical protein IPM79_28485 [Polyangiaceae bacterium]|nr:hypothetical protein [Polyangiaceae bacterium]
MIALAGGALALCAAVLARALGLRRAAELVVGTWLLGSAAVVALMHALTLAGAARLVPVALGTSAAAAGLLGCAAALAGPRGALSHARALVPSLAAAVAARARRSRLAAIALAITAAVLGHALAATWLLPSQSWDGIWYHDTIVGWVAQTGSAAPMPLPDNLLQQVNGFPRGAELTSAWLAILGGRALIELPNAMALAPLAAGAYLLAKRLTRERPVALALALVAALTPGALLQLSSTYVDVYAAAAAVAGLWLATRSPLAPRDVVLGGLAVALHVGAKSTAPLLAPFTFGALVSRAAWGKRSSRAAKAPRAAAIAFATAVTTASAALVYAKNALVYQNPLFPIDVRLARLGVAWPGVHSATDVDVNATAAQTLSTIFLPTPPGRDFADIRSGGYGLAVAWVVIPLAALGVARAVAEARTRGPIARGRALTALLPLALCIPSLALSPALWSARYNLHGVAVLAALAAYALAAPRWVRASLPAAVAALALSALAIARFDPPLGDAPLPRLLSAVAMSPEERACAATAEWTIEPDVARARERELGPGTLAVFGPGISFPSLLYNERFDNRVAFVGEQDVRALSARLLALDPTWLAASEGEALYRFAAQRPEQWERVGLLSRGHPTIAFRRLARRPDR